MRIVSAAVLSIAGRGFVGCSSDESSNTKSLDVTPDVQPAPPSSDQPREMPVFGGGDTTPPVDEALGAGAFTGWPLRPPTS